MIHLHDFGPLGYRYLIYEHSNGLKLEYVMPTKTSSYQAYHMMVCIVLVHLHIYYLHPHHLHQFLYMGSSAYIP